MIEIFKKLLINLFYNCLYFLVKKVTLNFYFFNQPITEPAKKKQIVYFKYSNKAELISVFEPFRINLELVTPD